MPATTICPKKTTTSARTTALSLKRSKCPWEPRPPPSPFRRPLRSRTRSCSSGTAQSHRPQVTAVVTDATMTFAPGAMQSIIASAATKSAPAEVAEAPAPASVAAVQAPPEGPAPVEPTASAPASPAVEPEPVAEIPTSSFAAEVAASYSVEGIAAPSSGEAEPKESRGGCGNSSPGRIRNSRT